MSRGWLLLFGLIGASLIPLVLGGSDMFSRLRAFPLDSLLLMFGMIVVCWFINGLRLRLLLAGRAGKLGQLQSVGIIMASEFAFCATPGGSGGPLTLMALLARRGLRPAQTSAVFAVDQLADLTFFLCALGAILIYALSHSLSPNMESSLIFSAVFLVGLFVGAVMLIRYLHQADPLQRAGSGAARRVIAQAPALGPQDPAFPHCPARQPAPAETTPAGGLPSAVRTGCCASACST